MSAIRRTNSWLPRLQTRKGDWNNSGSAVRPPIWRSLSVVLLVTLAAQVATWADVRTKKFKNTTGQAVDDLHIIFDNASVTVLSSFPSERVSADQKTHNYWGATIPNNGEAVVRWQTANGVNATIDKWWWTSGGNAVNDGGKIGEEQLDDEKGNGKKGRFSGGVATGNGQIQVSVGATSCTFQTVAGHTPDQSAEDLKAFLTGCLDASSDPIVYTIKVSPGILYILSNKVPDAAYPFSVQVLIPDTTQAFILETIAIPTLSEWGMISVGVLLLASGYWLLRRRRAQAQT